MNQEEGLPGGFERDGRIAALRRLHRGSPCAAHRALHCIPSRSNAPPFLVHNTLLVVLMMAITEHSLIAGIMTFLFYGVAPLTIILYLAAAAGRRRRRFRVEKKHKEAPIDGGSAKQRCEG